MPGSDEGATLRAPLVVAIDGPAGSGKTTVARRVAHELDLPLLDTGAIYRGLAWAARKAGIDWDDEPNLAHLADDFPIRFEAAADPLSPQGVFVGGDCVTTEIRAPEISQGASRVSAHSAVRAELLGIQRALAANGCVAEGRDMGTVVFPGASHKFFLTAKAAVRAHRRHAQLVAKAPASAPSLAAVAEDLRTRDERDTGRAVAPLAQAPDAHALDSTQLNAEQVVDIILAKVRGAEQV